jgi:biotin carboxyl carrier protein
MSSVPRASIALGVIAFLFWPLAVVLLVVIGQQSCQTGATDSGATTTASGPPTIVGDSITVMSRAALLVKFPGADVTAKGGMDWQWGLDNMPKPSHPTLAFLMGTNGQKRGTPQVTEADLRALVTAAPGVTTLVLMTNRMPNTALYSYQTDNNRLFTGAQSIVDSQTATLKRPRIAVHVVDWNVQSAAHPGWMGPDGIHPTGAGSQAIATLISQAIPAAPATSLAATSSNLAATSKPASGPWPPVKEGSIHYSQAQMQAAIAKYDPQQAVALGAIAMAESGGTLFPHNNSTGQYHSPWAMQAAWAAAQYDLNRLDGDLDYAAQAVAKLASTGITHGKWETWPAMAAKFMGGGAGSGAAAAVPVANMAPAGSTSNDCPAQTASATGPGGTASADGWTFPLRTTQAILRKGSQPADGSWVPWCYTSQSNCHHDYNAADLMAPTGTPVLAPMDGTVIMAHQGLGAQCAGQDNRGDTISYHTAAGDFFMGHFLTGSLLVHVGDHLKAGQQIAQVGRISEAQCTLPHLHIQLNPTGNAGGQGPDAVNIQPVLIKLFAKLPA